MMHLPKYSNPHLVVDTTRIVSRRTLQLEDDADADVERGGEVTGVRLDRREVEDLHMKLDEIVSKRLKLKRALAPSGEAHSSKRHKVLAEEGKPTPQQHPEPVAFRLISESLPPRAIHLTPKPPKVIPVKEPPCEDTEQELKDRVYRSVLSAVNLEQIEHRFPMVNDREPLRLFKTAPQPPRATPTLLLLEIPPTAPLPLLWINPRLSVPPKPSPHQLPTKGVCCPIIFTAPSHCLHDHERKGGRRRGKSKNKNKLVP